MNESATTPLATAGTARTSVVEAIVTSVAPESGTENLAVPKEQTALPKALEGMVRPTIQPLSPQVVPLAAAEEDEVEEIKRDEP